MPKTTQEGVRRIANDLRSLFARRASLMLGNQGHYLLAQSFHRGYGGPVTTVLLTAACASLCAISATSCTTDQVNQFRQNVAALTPSQTYTFVRDNKSYTFTTHKTTYSEVVKQLGPPTKSGTAPDGATVIMYRAVSDPDTSNRHDYTKYLSYLTISDATFVFDKDSLLQSAKIEDKSNDPIAVKEVRDREQKAHASTAPTSAKTENASAPTMDIQTRFEMALIEKNGNYRCSWPLNQKQKSQADERIKEYGIHINQLDYRAQISRGMSLGEHQTNAEFCLDGQERKKFDAATRYLAK